MSGFDAGFAASIAEVIDRLTGLRARLEEAAESVPMAPDEASLEDIGDQPDPRTLVRAILLSVARALPAIIQELRTAQEIVSGGDLSANAPCSTRLPL